MTKLNRIQTIPTGSKVMIKHKNGYRAEDLEIVEVEKSVINNYQIY